MSSGKLHLQYMRIWDLHLVVRPLACDRIERRVVERERHQLRIQRVWLQAHQELSREQSLLQRHAHVQPDLGKRPGKLRWRLFLLDGQHMQLHGHGNLLR
jgi:hypothetical protein